VIEKKCKLGDNIGALNRPSQVRSELWLVEPAIERIQRPPNVAVLEVGEARAMHAWPGDLAKGDTVILSENDSNNRKNIV
jgi:hypothetical protein